MLTFSLFSVSYSSLDALLNRSYPGAKMRLVILIKCSTKKSASTNNLDNSFNLVESNHNSLKNMSGEQKS